MKTITSQIIPINRSHIDTDLIIPAEFLRSIEKSGYGKHLFARLRASEEDFPFNLENYQQAKILIAGKNFGCGSSREHAAWALADWGISVIIAPSFADIFHQNAFNNQILPIVLSEEVIMRIFHDEAQQSQYEITIDLAQQTVTIPNGESFLFAIDPYKKECLLHGVDDLGYLLAKMAQIQAFQTKQDSILDTRVVNALIEKGRE